MKSKNKLPRKIKKALKLLILKDKDHLWKTKDVRIIGFKKNSRYKEKSPTIKGITVTHYCLGV